MSQDNPQNSNNKALKGEPAKAHGLTVNVVSAGYVVDFSLKKQGEKMPLIFKVSPEGKKDEYYVSLNTEDITTLEKPSFSLNPPKDLLNKVGVDSLEVDFS